MSDQPSEQPVQAPAAEAPFAGETHTISSELLDSLIEMGFSENAIHKSIVSGCINHDTCVQWITMHAGHAELDTPLDPSVRVVTKYKTVLTEEERLARVAAMKEKIRLKKASEVVDEAQRKIKAEKERIEMGKKVAEAKELRDAQQRANAYADMKKEKEADAKAKDRALLDVAIDKLVRQGVQPDDARRQATKESEQRIEERARRTKEEAQARLNEAAARSSQPARADEPKSSAPWNLSAYLQGGASQAPAPPPQNSELLELIIPPPTLEAFKELVSTMKSSSDAQKLNDCVSTIKLIINNILQNPLDIGKRTLKTNTNVFSNKIMGVKGAVTLLRMCNFDVADDGKGQQLVVMSSMVTRILYRALSALDG